MLTGSKNIMQEEWVQRWLDRLTPKQKVLVIEVLENSSKHRKPTQAAILIADVVVTNPERTAASFGVTTDRLNFIRDRLTQR